MKKSSKTRPRAVFVDAGGTLFHMERPVGEIYAEFAGRYGRQVDPAFIEKRFNEAFQRKCAVHSGPEGSLMDPEYEYKWWKELVRELFADLGGVPQFDKFFDELNSYFAVPERWVLFPEAETALGKLKKAGFSLAVLSNWNPRLEELCKARGIIGYMETVVVSSLVGASKPDARIFQEALGRLGTEPSSAVHVGDSLRDDVWGAVSCGIRAVWLRRGKSDGRRPGDEGLEKQLDGRMETVCDLMEAAERILAS